MVVVYGIFAVVVFCFCTVVVVGGYGFGNGFVVGIWLDLF